MADAERARGLSARIVTSLAEIDAIVPQWRALEARCGAELTYFQTASWCRCWVARFACEGRAQPRIRTLWRADRLVAVWPLMLVSGPLGVQRLENLGDPHSQYANMLCDRDEDAQGVAAALVEGLAGGEAYDVAVLNAVPRDSRLGRALTAREPIPPGADEASILDLSIFASSADYSAQLGKLQKRNRNRRRNHLARLGAVEFAVVWPSDPDYRRLLAECFAMKRRWLAESARYSNGFSYEGYEEFLAVLDGDEASLSGACLSVLSSGGRPVAMELGFLRNRHYYAYIGAFDSDLRHLSVGKIQMEMTVCWLIDRGVGAYDLLGNPADYKQSWTNRSVPLGAHTIPFSWRGRLYAGAWLRRLRPATKRLYLALPDRVRSMMMLNSGLGCLVFIG